MHDAERTGNAGADQWNVCVAHNDILIFMFLLTPAGAGECLDITILTLNNQPSTLNLPLSQRREDNSIQPRSCIRRPAWKVAAAAAASMFSLTAMQAWSQPVPGSLDVHWNEGAKDCTATPQAPLQVHTYEPQTFILRQSPCATFEANFLYLLIGSDKALLIDTGAVADPKEMPLAKTVLERSRSRP